MRLGYISAAGLFAAPLALEMPHSQHINPNRLLPPAKRNSKPKTPRRIGGKDYRSNPNYNRNTSACKRKAKSNV